MKVAMKTLAGSNTVPKNASASLHAKPSTLSCRKYHSALAQSHSIRASTASSLNQRSSQTSGSCPDETVERCTLPTMKSVVRWSLDEYPDTVTSGRCRTRCRTNLAPM